MKDTPPNQLAALAETVTTLSRQVDSLHKLFFPSPANNGSGNAGTRLGFVDHLNVPRTWVYVGEKESACWYTVVDDAPVPIKEQALVGTLKRIFGAKRIARGKAVFKLCFEIDAGSHIYVLQSGIDTLFSHGVIAALEAADPEILKGLLGIKVRPGDSDKVVFGSVYSMPSGQWVKAPEGKRFSKPAEVAAAAQAVCEKIGADWEVRDFTHQEGSARDA